MWLTTRGICDIVIGFSDKRMNVKHEMFYDFAGGPHDSQPTAAQSERTGRRCGSPQLSDQPLSSARTVVTLTELIRPEVNWLRGLSERDNNDVKPSTSAKR